MVVEAVYVLCHKLGGVFFTADLADTDLIDLVVTDMYISVGLYYVNYLIDDVEDDIIGFLF